MIRKIFIKNYILLFIILFPTIASAKIYTLTDCINLAKRNNFSIRKTAQNIAVTKAQYLSSYATILPNINATSSISRNSSILGDNMYNDTYSTNVSFNETVLDLPSIYRIKSLKKQLKGGIISYNAAASNLEISVANAFYDLLKKEKLLEVKKLGLSESEQNLKKTRLMYNLGTLSKVDLLRAEVIKNQSELDLLTAKKEKELSQANLIYLIGLQPDAEFDVKEETLKITDYSLNDYRKLLNEIKEKNPYIINKRLSLSAAKDEFISSYLEYLPTLSIHGSYGYSGDKFTLSKENWERNDSWSVGANLTLPLFTGFSRAAEIRGNKANLNIKEIELNDTIKQKGIELKKALLAIKETKKTLNLAEKNLEQAELSYKMVKEKYNLGAATILDLTGAEQDYEQAQVSKISAYYDLLLAKLYVTNLLGENILK